MEGQVRLDMRCSWRGDLRFKLVWLVSGTIGTIYNQSYFFGSRKKRLQTYDRIMGPELLDVDGLWYDACSWASNTLFMEVSWNGSATKNHPCLEFLDGFSILNNFKPLLLAVASGNLTVPYWKWPSRKFVGIFPQNMVDLSIAMSQSLPEGNSHFPTTIKPPLITIKSHQMVILPL